jgi:hypothetical protein
VFSDKNRTMNNVQKHNICTALEFWMRNESSFDYMSERYILIWTEFGILWNMAHYSLIEVCLHLGGTYCWNISRVINRQSKTRVVNFYQTSITFQKMILFVVISVRTSDFTDIPSFKFYLLCIVILSRKVIISRTKNGYFYLQFLPANQLFWREMQ